LNKLGVFLCGMAISFCLNAQVTLGPTVSTFAVLAGSTVTNSGNSVVTGNLGVSPGTAVTGFGPGVVIGTIHAADATALQAQTDLTAAYTTAAGLPCPGGNVLTGMNLGGLTLTPGVYCFATSAQLTGTLTLNALGSSTAQFIFQIGSTLTTASGSSVALINGAVPANIFFEVGSSATLGTTTSFDGNIMAEASISLNTGASLAGRALARTGAVTLLDNAITSPAGPGTLPVTPPSTPAPSSLILVATALAGVGIYQARERLGNLLKRN